MITERDTFARPARNIEAVQPPDARPRGEVVRNRGWAMAKTEGPYNSQGGRMRFTRITGLAATFVLGVGATAAAARNPLRFEELAKVARIGGFAVSPDGAWIAYGVGTPVVAENRSLRPRLPRPASPHDPH